MYWLSIFLKAKREESRPEFRAEIERLSVVGLRTIAVISIAANLLGYAIVLRWLPKIPDTVLEGDLIGLALLAAAMASTFWGPTRRYARPIGLVFLVLAAIGQVETASRGPFEEVVSAGLMPIMLCITLLLGLACLPLTPLQTLALGGSITAVSHWMRYGRVRMFDLAFVDALPVAIMVVVTMVATALTVVVYAQRALAFSASREAKESLAALEKAQSRLLVSETASSQNRLAAALCHELNTPLGALQSALGTLVSAHRMARELPERRDDVESVFAEASRAGEEALERMGDALERMKRVTNLDRSEVRELDVNLLVSDTVGMLGEAIDSPVRLELGEPPKLRGRPQPLTAVLSNLIRNAAAASQPGHEVCVATRSASGELVVEVRDDGRGMSEDEVAALFEPSFRADGGRVKTTNWSMFVARGIIHEHGGHIEVDSEPGVGTTVRVFLPTAAGGEVDTTPPGA